MVVEFDPVPVIGTGFGLTPQGCEANNISLATAVAPFTSDEPTAKVWEKLPGGSLLGKLISPILGGHRFISHSLLGIFLFGFLIKYILTATSTVILVDMEIVWRMFMVGYISHLIMDTFTKECVPWLFPIPIKFGFPPLKALRIKTGGLIEKSIIFPGLLLINAYLFYNSNLKTTCVLAGGCRLPEHEVRGQATASRL